MAFTDFTFPEVLADLSLQLRERDLYESVAPLAVPADFVARLLEDAALARAVATEKARSGFVVAPILLELRRLAPGRFGLFSGVELLGQCIAEMVAARVLNERAQQPGPVHGAVTTGTAWQFLRLDGDALTLDTQEYHVEQVARILAILRSIVSA